ncbi:hypothetical protein Vadar_027602 [Vaccinium darrowii]|uniref:Uncharacterized protein n=1 Tax=Vaccinium darrowii TaxID=229202 RepID=A0ACB7Y3Q6_9ERIC|nr:hypothetical protein Vadar_027602 [Vaccinium darrowii]
MGTSSFSSTSIPPSSFPSIGTNTFITDPVPTSKIPKHPRKCLITLSVSPSPTKHIWKRTTQKRPKTVHLDHSVDMGELLSSIQQTTNEHQLFDLMSPYKNQTLSIKFMVSLLSKEPDWQRSLALLDWINEQALYSPSVFAYNVVLRNVLRAKQWQLAHGLFDEMRERAVSPDKYTYFTLITHFGKQGLFDDALSWLSKMEKDRVTGDLVLYSNLIELSRKLRDYSKAISVFSRLKSSEMRSKGVIPDMVDMTKEADRLFWNMTKMGIEPSVVSYNTLLRVYGEAELFGEAIHLFRLMQRKDIEQNVVTYNTMISIHGKSLEHEKANSLVQEMQRRGIEPNAIAYSTIISIWAKVRRLDRAKVLFQKLRDSGVEIDQHPENIPRGTAIRILARAGCVDEAMWVFRQAFDEGEVKDIAVFGCMVDLLSTNNRRYGNVIEVFEKMRGAWYFPDSVTIALVLNAYGKLREFGKVDALYKEMQNEGCVFPDAESLLGKKGF